MTLGTSVINSPISLPSLLKCDFDSSLLLNLKKKRSNSIVCSVFMQQNKISIISLIKGVRDIGLKMIPVPKVLKHIISFVGLQWILWKFDLLAQSHKRQDQWVHKFQRGLQTAEPILFFFTMWLLIMNYHLLKRNHSKKVLLSCAIQWLTGLPFAQGCRSFFF